MEFHFTADGAPRYLQLTELLAQAITHGDFGKCGKLPTCTELCAMAGVSPGTVKAAWAELEKRGLITRTRGSGIYAGQTPSAGGRVHSASEGRFALAPDETKSQIVPANQTLTEAALLAEPFGGEAAAIAEDAAAQLAEYLLSLRFITPAEAFELFQEALEQEFSTMRRVRAAWVDCTVETLHTTIRQLSAIEQLSVTPFLQDDLFLKKTFIGPEYDIVLTTPLHFADLARFLAPQHLRVEQVGLRESRGTITALSTIPEEDTICIFYRSAQLLSSIRYTLGVLGRQNKQVCACEEQLDDTIEAQLRAGCTLIIPPDSLEYSSVRMLQFIERAHKCGCRVIPFEFELDKGSMLHLVQRVRELGREERP